MLSTMSCATLMLTSPWFNKIVPFFIRVAAKAPKPSNFIIFNLTPSIFSGSSQSTPHVALSCFNPLNRIIAFFRHFFQPFLPFSTLYVFNFVVFSASGEICRFFSITFNISSEASASNELKQFFVYVWSAVFLQKLAKFLFNNSMNWFKLS